MASHPTDLAPAYFTLVGHQCTSGYVSLLFAVEITHFLLYSKSCLWPPESPLKCSCQGPCYVSVNKDMGSVSKAIWSCSSCGTSYSGNRGCLQLFFFFWALILIKALPSLIHGRCLASVRLDVLLMLTGHLSFPKQIQGRTGLGAKELGGEERGETATGM